MMTGGAPPPPAPAPDYPGASGPRRSSTSPERRGRSRTAERPRQGPVRRIRSTGPGGAQQGQDIDGVMELHRSQERRMLTCGGYRARRQQESSSQVREMEELRARTQQMEKTLKWWSDCTANWREKWTKVRIERNKAIEEVRETRREADRLAAERDRVREENEMLRSEVRELRSRGNGEDQSRGNTCREDSIARNFGIMNSFFMSLSNEAEEVDHTIFQHTDPWLDSNTHPSSTAQEQEKKRQNSCHNIFEADEDFQRDFFSEFSRPKSVGTIPKSRRKQSTNISDPCLLSCLPSDVLQTSTNTSELNSVDSGIPDEITTNGQVTATEDPQSSEKTKTSDKDLQNPRVFVERKIEFCETKPDYRSRVNSLGHNLGHCRGINNNNNHNNSNIELINSKLSKTQEELGSLKIAHGKLQKVLSEKASELSHAVRKAEVYEREAKKLRYKLDEVRRQQRQDRQDRTSSEKECNKANREKVSFERRKNISDSITNNQTGREKIPNLVKILNEDIYDEVEDIAAASTTTHDTDDKNIYDVPRNNEHTKGPQEDVPKGEEPMPDKDNSEIIKNKSDDNKKSVVDNNQNSDDPCSNHAIYATVNLEMKKNSKRQKDCSNGNLLISEKENIVAMI